MDNIAIVGGGIAGLTSAVHLVALGCKVTVFESRGDIIHLQRGNLTRFLHPNIATWPDPEFGYPITHMPFLNWRAGTAGEVEAQLRRQIQRFCAALTDASRFKIKKNWPVLKVTRDGDGFKIFSDQQRVESASMLLLAPGYGVEIPKFGTTPSYWRNDDFSQTSLGSAHKLRYLVSGTGDGGLVDVLRLKIGNFQHQQFIQQVMFEDSIQDLANQLLEELRTQKPEEVWQKFLEQENSAAERFFASIIKDDIRSEKVVKLNSRRRCPFDTNSQILHRLLVALLIKSSHVDLVIGELTDVYASPDSNELVVRVQDEAKRDHFERVDVLVSRHNSQPTLPQLIGDAEYKRSKTENDSAKTSEPIFPPYFLADAFMAGHYEGGYEVGIILDPSIKPLTLVSEIIERLEYAHEGLSIPRPTELPASITDGEGRSISFQIGNHGFWSYPKLASREHKECLIFKTCSRELLEQALTNDQKYHYIRTKLSGPNFEIDPVGTDMHTHAWSLYDKCGENRFLEVQYWKPAEPHTGMFIAHRLLRVTRVHGMGWAVCQTARSIRRDPRANKLLQWDGSIAWWSPLESQLTAL
ncbi:MAG: FAD-binding oxidoreductase [Candidatus Obscuribacter sp.]|nr:FAD-binding oxidoreductase [Candidatus Obscuribacter sp.]